MSIPFFDILIFLWEVISKIMPPLLLLKIHKLSKVISQLYGLRPSRADTSTLL